MTKLERPRVLFIDAYDSFSNNIISLLETSLNVEVSDVKIDTPIRDLPKFLSAYVAVIAGPGPGDARTTGDVGLFQRLWELEGSEAIPVLGICLGFQSLVLAYGGGIERLPEPRHGIVRTVSSNEESIFRGVPSLKAVQYHSLHATLGSEHGTGRSHRGRDHLVDVSVNAHLTPLAWDNQTDNDVMHENEKVKRNRRSILMAVKHKKKPFYGIQFHPESICSSREARKIIKNWWDEICVWRADISKHQNFASNGLSGNFRTNEKKNLPAVLDRAKRIKSEQQSKVIFNVIDLAHLTLPIISEIIGATDGEAIIFDSEKHQSSETGAFSIIGIIENVSSRFEYRIGRPDIIQICSGKVSTINLNGYSNNVFGFLESHMAKHKAVNGDPSVPFWGGLMGHISYATCLETLGISDSIESDSIRPRPDLGFVLVERSIVIDHIHGKVHVQSIKSADHSWVGATTSLLSTAPLSTRDRPLRKPPVVNISFPNEKIYKSQIRACQAAIRAGDSYELCLTNQTNISTLSKIPPWPMYRRLRNINPAPFGAYIRVGNLTVLSSSPERFMRWSRPTESHRDLNETPQSPGKNTCVLQFRPIKGTIARLPTPDAAPRSLIEATRLLSTQKEQAENLMIVDLIRHDLHGVVGSGKVSVPKLMIVEEYETVFQLVSVIEGTMIVKPPSKLAEEEQKRIDHPKGEFLDLGNGFHDSSMDEDNDQDLQGPSNGASGIRTALSSALQPKPSSPLAALPGILQPGSMTVAPKLRSCQLLHSLEATSRGVYSGIIGYIDVGGGGDWSVAIRCAVRWDNPESAGDHWTIGAGGAVTALSTEQGEWEEMLAKLQATLRIFQD